MEFAMCSAMGMKYRSISPKNLTRHYGHKFSPTAPRNGTVVAASRPSSSSSTSFGLTTNGHVYEVSSSSSQITSNNGRFYRRQDSCLVIAPPSGTKPRAIIKFLGGAFIGAVPEVTYSYLIEQLAQEGFLIISVPYNVTFDHAQAAAQVYESNGALLQVLVGSYFSEKVPKANVIISYNNKPATEAVPYFEQLGPLVRQIMPVVEASPIYAMTRSASEDAWKMLLDVAGAMIPEGDRESLVSLNKFVDQLPSVLNQVTQGISEFRPNPSENRDRCKSSYNVQHTLLVKFSFDTIDETDLLEEALKSRVEFMGGTLEKVQLSGNHITPCAQEPNWQVGYVYTPADAIAQGLKTLSLNETRQLARTITNWLGRFED